MTSLVRIVLIDPSHPGNIGSVARAMKNMALEDLVLVRPRAFPHSESKALAAGADDVLDRARVVEDLREAVADCGLVAGTTSRPRHLNWDFLTPRDLALRVAGLAADTRVALLFGSERYGLANGDLDFCHVLVRIPANPDYCSLNLAMSVQLLSYELLVAREHPVSHTQVERELANGEQMELMYRHLARVMDYVGFEDRNGEGHLMTRIRRLFNRAQPDQNEVNILRGFFTAIEGTRRPARRGESGS
ncbi:MAG: RNA methyltransferase [Proteobacteria bacterium]|nr:RNA methyltransferase [Pseudomonadota bacterium]